MVKFQTASEFSVPQFMDRAVRQLLVKLFDVEEYVLQNDLTELIRRIEASKESSPNNVACFSSS